MKELNDMSTTENEKVRVTGAEALLMSLLAEGVKTLFGYPGGAIIPVYDHLYGYTDRLHHILTRHEQGAVHAAQGFARATGQVGVCLATSGPGATNLVTGIADAMIDSTPLVCITAQVAASALGSDAFQEADIISMTMPVTKWNFQITRAEEIPGAIAKAFYIARSGRPGPVVIDFTKNAQTEMLDFHYTPCTSLRSYQPVPPLPTTAIAQAIEMINTAEKPLLLIGQGILLSNAENDAIALAEQGGIPMATSLLGISAVPTNHPLYVGNIGMHGNLAPNEMTQQSDLIISVGMRFSDLVTGDVKSYAPHAKVIHIDIDAAVLNKCIPAALPILADAKQALQAMLPEIKHKERPEWLTFAAQKRNEEHESVVKTAMHPAGGGITMCQAVQALADAEHGDAIIVTDVGQNQMFGARYSRFNTTRSFITSGGLGTMGFGLPAAVGAKLGRPDREVVAILGDGGIQMTIQELGTIKQEHLGVKIVVLNNSYLGMVRQWQQLFYEQRYSFTAMDNPDFTMIAAAYGIPAARVSQPEELPAAMQKLAEADGPYFLEVVVRPEDNVFPMVPAGASLSNVMCKE